MPDPPPRKRQRQQRRPAKSCLQCRQRKIRCDRTVPCGPCTRARSPLPCSYQHRLSLSPSPSPNPIAAPPLLPCVRRWRWRWGMRTGTGTGTGVLDREGGMAQLGAVVRDLQRRLQRVEARLSRSGTGLESESQSGSGSGLELERALREVCDKVERLERRLVVVVDSSRDSAGGGHGDGDGDGDGEMSMSVAATPPRLHASARKMKLFGPTHYGYTMDKLQLVGSLETKGPLALCPEARAELASQIREVRDLRRSVKMDQTPRLNDPVSDLRRTIPARPVCDELVECYLRTFEGIYRIVHLPSFRKEYRHFWDDNDGSLQVSATPFLIKLVLILAIGTTFHPQRGKAGAHSDPQLFQTWIYAAQWWLTGPSEKASFNLDGLQIFCLLLLARQLGPPGPSPWLSAGALLQLATAMGLHRDSALFPSLSPFLAEMRTRLWATVLELTLQPPAPIIINNNPHPIPSHTDTSLQLLLHQSFSLRAETIQLIHSPQRIPYQKALALATALRNACHSITAFFAGTNTSSIPTTSPDSLPHPGPFHHKYLLTTLNRYILHLHLPFARAAPANPQFHFSRRLCLDAALGIAATVADNKDDFTTLTTTARGPLRGPLNLDIICTLAFELLTQIEESSFPFPIPTSSFYPYSHPSTRLPILHVLQSLRDQSLYVLRLGTPALKRYVIVEALVGEICALEGEDYSDGQRHVGNGISGNGTLVQTRVYEIVRGCLGVWMGEMDLGFGLDFGLGGLVDWEGFWGVG
ncbi:hypothetical protein BO70DRAFT_388000 [Aspergillus heteromorphus CBS 117.55]|uniref:Zn(2)-C6 fungal-type domain-containing protein n=1 Tax=Aspergillus heteromorphus CBS 117.55 TaxID=1448321 RepID=A0A317VYD1_9EURO|nr:uncharacterized protein BO70DRAFT_388000 [Aspergillus heteromorphus CBS 117.55]PWY79283.1 hypothetical protein BO70DRAFT_388000 [Aspergillus heteromorphus CBS 117.55]